MALIRIKRDYVYGRRKLAVHSTLYKDDYLGWEIEYEVDI